MAAVAAPPPPPTPLALEWYKHTPLPDLAPPEPLLLGPTDLSQRLLSAFDAGAYCDIALRSGPDGEIVRAHRIVLRRNPALSAAISNGSSAGQDLPEIRLSPGICVPALHAVVRAHYLEAEEGPGSAPACMLAQAELRRLRAERPETELSLLEAGFGPLDASKWRPLSENLFSPQFADCALRLPNGQEVFAHRVVLAGTEDGHFFSGALRWPVGAMEENRVVTMPQGLQLEALEALLRARYGSPHVEVEHILEVRHFAELFDWTDVCRRCEQQLEAMLANSGHLDAESLLAVVAHAQEESTTLPPKLKAAALSAAVRQWSKVTAAAETALSERSNAELRTLSRIRERDGHVCPSLEEYLYAAFDDLIEWERSMAPNANPAVRRNCERAWRHWQDLLLEFGRLAGAATAERWRSKALVQREAVREERARAKGEQMGLPAGRVWFEATFEFQEVPPNAVCPGGLEYRCDMQTGRNWARLPL